MLRQIEIAYMVLVWDPMHRKLLQEAVMAITFVMMEVVVLWWWWWWWCFMIIVKLWFMDKGKQKNQYLEINIYWIYCRLSFIRIMFLYVVCWMILLTMKGKRKEKKSDALQTKTDWTPRLWVEAQCSICPTTYLRSHRTPITCFIHSREKRKRKEQRKENEKSDAHGLEQTKADQTTMLGHLAQYAQLHKTAIFCKTSKYLGSLYHAGLKLLTLDNFKKFATEQDTRELYRNSSAS